MTGTARIVRVLGCAAAMICALALLAPAAHAATGKCIFGLNDTLGANQAAMIADDRNDALGALRQNVTAQRLLTVATFDCIDQPTAVVTNIVRAIAANTQALLQNALGRTAQARAVEDRDVRGYVVAALSAIP